MYPLPFELPHFHLRPLFLVLRFLDLLFELPDPAYCAFPYLATRLQPHTLEGLLPDLGRIDLDLDIDLIVVPALSWYGFEPHSPVTLFDYTARAA
jgi:hypothetical protein